VASRKKRKQRQRGVAQDRPPSRSEQRDAQARAALVPLAPGERPTVVTVGAIVAAVNGVATLVVYALGVDVRGGDSPLGGTIALAALSFSMAWGMWETRYWAVLGMQALLALTILVFSLALVVVPTIWWALVEVIVIGAAGTLFWFMVKAMARIQMPSRDQ
jgi:hypothetical protein